MLNTNLDYLREENKVLHDKLENELNNHVQIIDAKNGMKTIQIKKNNKTQFLHSVYNPKAETELFVKKVIEEKRKCTYYFYWYRNWLSFTTNFRRIKSTVDFVCRI